MYYKYLVCICVLFITTFRTNIVAQIFQDDTVFVIIYDETNYFPHNPNFFTTKQRKLIIDNEVSYYFISNPQFVADDSTSLISSIIKFADSNYILFNRPMSPKYDRYTYFSDTLHPMKWEITGKKIDLNGRIGYEAITFFRGRHFTAYYDPNIPFSNGPLKFGGLPGLIIKFFDRDRIWFFELKSITRERRSFLRNKINYAGDYQKYLSIYPEWSKRMEEKYAANGSVNPNCPTCGTKTPTYHIEIY